MLLLFYTSILSRYSLDQSTNIIFPLLFLPIISNNVVEFFRLFTLLTVTSINEPAQQEKQIVGGPTATDSLPIVAITVAASHAPGPAALVIADDDGLAGGYDRRHQNQGWTIHW